jgi:predicted ArsR family transcriptional regulator
VDRPNLEAQLDRAAALGDPVRRALYRFVAAASDPVTRDAAAAGVGVAHHVAKFHLDRLVQDGLLVFEYRRPPGRGGPGAGRPAKLYRRADAEVDVTLPPRRYQLAGELLLEAMGTGRNLADVARDTGRATGSRARQSRSTVSDVLAEHGYEPRAEGRDIVLANCPFHALAHKHTQLVCGMNLAFLEGVVGGLGTSKVCPQLDPGHDRCCVRLVRAGPSKAV